MQNTPLISIIIPVYNVEKYLQRCLDSILSQTYTNWECLLIDDGSKDSSGYVCDEYASKDNRFRVFHKENGGVSSARNVGLDNARGELITFSDSDDELFPDSLEYYSNIFSQHDVDIVRCGYRKQYESGSILDMVTSSDIVISDKQEIFLACEDNMYWGFLWNSCIKTSIANNHKFDTKISWGEDHIYTYECMHEANRIFVSTKIAYKYHIDDVSGIKTLSTIHKDYKMLEYVAERERDVKMKFYSDSDSVLSFINNEYDNVLIVSIKEALYMKRYKEAFRILRKIRRRTLLKKTLDLIKKKIE